MSGICAAVQVRTGSVPAEVVRTMAAAAPHRGTGRVDVTTTDSGALAMLRRHGECTSTARGRRSASGVCVVADARLDNRAELRGALNRSGHLHGDTADDAALLVAAYEAWGIECPRHVVGDFAFVLWDSRRRVLLAARDPLGMRNLFLRHEPDGRVLLATEVKQILAVPGVPAAVFEPAAAADLVAHFGEPDWSFYEGVRQVGPGTCEVIDAAGRRTSRFWCLDAGTRLEVGSEEAAEALRRAFTEAVAARLDDPRSTGILLSGGVDSVSVASVAGWLHEQGEVRTPSLHAFSWAFQRLSECDERAVSRLVVERYGLAAHDIPADDAGPLACFPEHLPDRDDPMIGGFQPLIEHSLEAARSAGVGVLLGGDRGDLVIGATGLSYLGLAQHGQWGDLRGALGEHRRALGDPWALLLRRHLAGAVAGRLRRRTPVQWVAWAARRSRGRASGAPSPDWVRPAFLRGTGVADLLSADRADEPTLDVGRRERYRAVTTPLHMRGVAWSERTYARYGIGFADPFSDRRVVELAVSLPQAVIGRPGDAGKPLMRQAVQGLVPAAALARASKVVPQPLFDAGLRDVAELVRALLVHPQVEQRGWVDAAALRAHFEGWLQGGTLRAEFWWTLQVEIWLQTHWS
jgi:asparagine synthase (glutamine-hydrolysing)